MKTMKKIFLTVISLLWILSGSVYALGGLSVSSDSGKIGDTVTVQLSMENNGCCVGSVLLQYDPNVLEFVKNSFSKDLSSAMPMINPTYKSNQIKLNWMSTNSEINFENFCTLEFKIKPVSQDSTDITIEEFELYRSDFKGLSVTTSNGIITVENPLSSPPVSSGTASGSGGGSLKNPSQNNSDNSTASDNIPKTENDENPTLIANYFSDVKSTDWFYDAVMFAYESNITSGISETEFAPQVKVTRGQFITMLCRAYNIPKMQGENFSDCGDTWYTGYLAAAKQLGISNGTGDNKFSPEAFVTREEAVTLLCNYINKDKQTSENAVDTDFVDTMEISGWAKTAVAYCAGKGYVNGNENNFFLPKAHMTRAELASIFMRILK